MQPYSLVDSAAFLVAVWLFAAWPPVCVSLGEVYQAIAQARDAGVDKKTLEPIAQQKGMKRVIDQVYGAPKITPDQWKHIAIGSCMGVMENDGSRERQPIRPPPARQT